VITPEDLEQLYRGQWRVLGRLHHSGVPQTTGQPSGRHEHGQIPARDEAPLGLADPGQLEDQSHAMGGQVRIREQPGLVGESQLTG
jgi:hypothetical protein